MLGNVCEDSREGFFTEGSHIGPGPRILPAGLLGQEQDSSKQRKSEAWRKAGPGKGREDISRAKAWRKDEGRGLEGMEQEAT
jgi:hypothetical protein